MPVSSDDPSLEAQREAVRHRNSPTSATSVQALSPLATSSAASPPVAARRQTRPDMGPTGC